MSVLVMNFPRQHERDAGTGISQDTIFRNCNNLDDVRHISIMMQYAMDFFTLTDIYLTTYGSNCQINNFNLQDQKKKKRCILAWRYDTFKWLYLTFPLTLNELPIIISAVLKLSVTLEVIGVFMTTVESYSQDTHTLG